MPFEDKLEFERIIRQEPDADSLFSGAGKLNDNFSEIENYIEFDETSSDVNFPGTVYVDGEEVITEDELGTAATRDVGTGAEDVPTNEIIGVQTLSSDLSVTVGTSGDYATLQEAFDFAYGFRSGGGILTINILSGTTLTEGVELIGGDLRFVTVTCEDSEVMVDIPSSDDNFFVIDACFGPRIEALFNLDGTGRQGIQAGNGSAVVIQGPDAGFKNSGRDNVFVTNQSSAVCGQCDFTGGGRFGIGANNLSRINASNSDASGASDHGLNSAGGSHIRANNIDARIDGATEQSDDIRVLAGSFISLSGTVDGGTNVTPNEVTSNGIIFR